MTPDFSQEPPAIHQPQSGRIDQRTGGNAVHLQSVSARAGLAIRHVYVCARRRHAHHDEPHHSDLPRCRPGAGALLVARCSRLCCGCGGRIYGHIVGQSENLFGWRFGRCVRVNHRAHCYDHYGEWCSFGCVLFGRLCRMSLTFATTSFVIHAHRTGRKWSTHSCSCSSFSSSA